MNNIKNHEYYEMLISRNKDNDLNNEEILEMEKHLLECKKCRQFKEDIYSMSSILTGNISIKVNKKPTKFIPYIASIAAMLLIFIGVGIVINNNIFVENNTTIVSNIAAEIPEENNDIYSTYDDYTLLSTYFDYSEENNNNADDDNITVLSAYMAYME